MDNREIARILRRTAELIELTGGNPFRARAFSQAARTLRQQSEPVEHLLRHNKLTEIPGIGATMAAHIEEILQTGTLSAYERLKKQIPEGLIELLNIKGLGPKKLRQLWLSLDITSPDQLQQALEKNLLTQLSGFGPRTQEKIKQALEQYFHYRERYRFADVYAEALQVLHDIRAFHGVIRAEWTGDFRRLMETIAQVDFLVYTTQPEELKSLLQARLEPIPFTPATRTAPLLFAGISPSGVKYVFFQTDKQSFGTTWWTLTGAPAHIEQFENTFGSPPPEEEEQAIYHRVHLRYIVPELREGHGELEAAQKNTLPRLITERDLKGSLHNHTTYSDGIHTLKQMADAAQEMGLSYLGIADHSQSLRIANGLSIERVREQQEEIRTLNATYAAQKIPFKIFSGTECDILADGSLDYPDDVLASFDYVVASIHQGFRMTRKEATRRLIKAIENPYTTILGHPTGRLLLVREGYPIDHRAVIKACASHGVVIELNANPYRLDIDWRWIREAIEQGVLISINPDAHHIQELKNVTWGVRVARKGWLTPEACLNARSLTDFEHWLNVFKQRRQAN